MSRVPYWVVKVPKPRFDDSPEAARFLLGGWLLSFAAASACLSGAHVAALSLGSTALGLSVLAVFA